MPPETFYSTGTQANTVVVFVQKYLRPEDRGANISTVVATVSNVGYDSTGRSRTGSQLIGLAKAMLNPKKFPAEFISVVNGVIASESFDLLTKHLASKRRHTAGIRLGDIINTISTGRTPPRAAYSDCDGLFLVKVGNLSGSGINWMPRDRNFIQIRASGGKFNPAPCVTTGDILLTSSAHSPVYIAKKVDIVTNIPRWVGGSASFVGEVMRLRANQDRISPFRLLAFLRQPATMAEIQEMVRGQTAHLHADDVSELRLPDAIFDVRSPWSKLEQLLKEEAKLSERLNELARLQTEAFKSVETIKAAA